MGGVHKRLNEEFSFLRDSLKFEGITQFVHTANCESHENIILFPINILADFSLVDSSGNLIKIGATGEGLLLYKSGTVCDDDFDDISAEVICRLLRYSGYSSWSSGSKWEIQNNYNINMSEIQCSSGNWSFCTYTTNQNCEHSEDTFLDCAGKLLSR